MRTTAATATDATDLQPGSIIAARKRGANANGNVIDVRPQPVKAALRTRTDIPDTVHCIDVHVVTRVTAITRGAESSTSVRAETDPRVKTKANTNDEAGTQARPEIATTIVMTAEPMGATRRVITGARADTTRWTTWYNTRTSKRKTQMPWPQNWAAKANYSGMASSGCRASAKKLTSIPCKST